MIVCGKCKYTVYVSSGSQAFHQSALTCRVSVHFYAPSDFPALHSKAEQKQQQTAEEQHQPQDGDDGTMGVEAVGYSCNCNANH